MVWLNFVELSLTETIVDPTYARHLDSFWNVPVTWGLGFCKPKADVEGRRRKNSISWDGARCTQFCIDYTSGVGFVFFTQMDPSGDVPTYETFNAFERAM